MNVKVADVMSSEVKSLQPHHTVDHARNMMSKNSLHALPVVDPDGSLRGIVSSQDLAKKHKDNTPVSSIMTQDVYTIPMYNDVHLVARLMRNHKIHHVVVTHEKKVTGIISSFDLLKLVEDHRFTIKNPPSESKRSPKRK